MKRSYMCGVVLGFALLSQGSSVCMQPKGKGVARKFETNLTKTKMAKSTLAAARSVLEKEEAKKDRMLFLPDQKNAFNVDAEIPFESGDFYMNDFSNVPKELRLPMLSVRSADSILWRETASGHVKYSIRHLLAAHSTTTLSRWILWKENPEALEAMQKELYPRLRAENRPNAKDFSRRLLPFESPHFGQPGYVPNDTNSYINKPEELSKQLGASDTSFSVVVQPVKKEQCLVQ